MAATAEVRWPTSECRRHTRGEAPSQEAGGGRVRREDANAGEVPHLFIVGRRKRLVAVASVGGAHRREAGEAGRGADRKSVV